MGRVKDWLMEQEQRGWWSTPNKHACTECFNDDSLRQVLQNNADASICDYCGSTAEELTGDPTDLIAAPLDSVVEVIAQGISSEWNDANAEGIMYESAEGGYQADTVDTYDLVWRYVDPNCDALADDIIAALPDYVWVRRNYYSLREDQALWYGWENFCRIVKHENRYMFHLRRRKAASTASTANSETSEGLGKRDDGAPATAEISETIDANPDVAESLASRLSTPISRDDATEAMFEQAWEEAQEGISASEMLNAIGEAIEQVDILTTITQGTKFFRGRLGSPGEHYRTARTLGPPPSNKAPANRMSPAGIPMFYGALDERTAILETVPGKLKRGERITVGAFVSLEDLFVLDLTRLGSIPSIFSERRYLRAVTIFLRSFVEDLSRAIQKDGREHIQYVPTQIITEYFRHAFRHCDGQSVQGILYPSARAPNGISAVLFVNREECGAPQRGSFGDKTKQRLQFVRGSARVFDRKPRRTVK